MTVVGNYGRWLWYEHQRTKFYVTIKINVCRVRFFLPPIISLRGRCYDHAEWNRRKPSLEPGVEPVPFSLPYTFHLRSVREPWKPSLKKIHFLDNDRTSKLQPSLRNGGPNVDARRKVPRKTSCYNYRPQHAALGNTNLTAVGREFHETEANFETRKIR